MVKQVIRVPAILNDGAHRPVQEAIRRANDNFGEVYKPLDPTAAELAVSAVIVNPGYKPLNLLRYGTNSIPFTTDMAAAFATLGNVARNMGRAEVVIPPGDYATTDSTWSYGIEELTILGYGARLKNILASSSGSLNNGFHGNRPVYAGGSPSQYNTNDNGTLIQTTAPRDTTITCITPAEAGNAVVGQRAMIVSYNLQTAGYPPSYAYHQIVLVTAKDAGTGVITLDRALLHKHRSDFPEIATNLGKARIYFGDKAKGGYISKSLTIYGLEVVTGPGVSGGVSNCSGAETIRLVDFTTPGLTGGQTNHMVLENTRVTESSFDCDKEVRTLSINSSTIIKMIESSGVDYLEAAASQFMDWETVAPRHLKLSGCTVLNDGVSSTTVVNLKQQWPTYSVAITDTKLINTGSAAYGAVSCGSLGTASYLLPSSEYSISGDVISINKTATNVFGFLRNALVGAILVFNNFTAGAGKARVITVYEDASFYNIQVRWLGDVTGATGFFLHATVSLTLAGNDYVNCFWGTRNKALINNVEGFSSNEHMACLYNTGVDRITGYLPNEVNQEQNLYGRFVTGVEINVLRAYTGTDSIRYAAVLGKAVDLKVAGKRTYTVSGAYGTSGGDTATAFVPAYYDDVDVYSSTVNPPVSVTPAGGTAAQQGIYMVTLRFDPYYFDVYTA
jgi:hypothetical protein